MLSGKNIVITGGAGFIGSNLCAYFLKQGNRVRCLDNFLTGKRENIAALLTHPDFTLIEGDIRNAADCLKAMQGADLVLHQAALGSVPRSIHDPLTTNDINITGFLQVLTAARDSGIKRVVYAASSSTYGDSAELPKREDRIGKPLSPYAVTKYVNELYAGVFASLYGMELIGLRYFNVFGRHQDPEGTYAAAIPRFIRMLRRGELPLVYGDGSQTRDFTYIDNVIQANEKAALVSDPEALNTVYNVACGDRTTLNELLHELKSLLSEYDPKISHIAIKYTEPRAGEVQHSLADIRKARTLLGYEPSHSLKKGLREAIQWYVEAGW